MAGSLRYRGGRFAIVMGCCTALFAAGCGGNDDGSGTEDPLIQEGSNVIPSGTGPGTTPAPPAESITSGSDLGAPTGGGVPGQAGAMQDTTI